MPIAQILQSLKGTCRFCRQQAGLLQRDHQDCQETHRSGWQEMIQLAAQAATARTFNEQTLRQTLAASPSAPTPPNRTSTAPLTPWPPHPGVPGAKRAALRLAS
jgi:hypothetical protein